MKSSKPKVAVLLATFNGMPFISSQIASILAQVDVSVDIFIRDDFSTDGTSSAIAKFPQDNIFILDSNITLFPGLRGSALNFYNIISSSIVSASEYDWFAFSDQDDIWFPTKLISSISQCTSAGSVAYSSSMLPYWPHLSQVKYVPKQGFASSLNFLFESPGPGCSFVIRSDVFSLLQHFVLNHSSDLLKFEFHDWFIYAFVQKYFGSWFISSFADFLYVQHSSNVVGIGFSYYQILKKLSLLYSGWYRKHVLLLASLLGFDDVDIVRRFQRMSLIDRIVLPFIVFPHRRRLKDRILLFLVLPFSRKSYHIKKVF